MSFLFLIFAAILCVVSLAIILKIIGQRKHLSDNDLRSLSRLNPSDDNYSRIVGHIGQCEQCRNRMDDLQHELDHLVED